MRIRPSGALWIAMVAAPGIALILVEGSSAAFGGRKGEQPIEYNHFLHTQTLEMACVTCHRHVEDSELAGPPPLEVCLECHESPLTENPEEHKLQEMAATGFGLRWVRLTFLPDHVYFSHRRHVTVGGIDCKVCHGPMEMQTSPPRGPLKELSMSDCMDCHEDHGASTDCNACHR